MKNSIKLALAAVGATLLTVTFVIYSSFDIVPSSVPPPTATITVETENASMGSAITAAVGDEIMRNPELNQMIRGQGVVSAREYNVELRGSCAQARTLTDAVTKVVRNFTQAPVMCMDPA